MSTISDQLPEAGRPPILDGHIISSAEAAVREKALREQKAAYTHTWTLYLTDGGQCSYQDILTAFSDTYEFIIGDAVMENTLIGEKGIGFLLEPGSDWDGNPKDGYRRGIDIISGGFPDIHFSCWIGEEWQYDPRIRPRFELPIRIKTNWQWTKEKELWQFMQQRFAKIGYTDSTLSTSFKNDLMSRLKELPEEWELLGKN